MECYVGDRQSALPPPTHPKRRSERSIILNRAGSGCGTAVAFVFLIDWILTRASSICFALGVCVRLRGILADG